jgi:hypothetical protein
MGKTAYAPPDLDAVPEVDTLMQRLGLGSFDRDSLTSAPGRNEAWKGTTVSGNAVFVKRLVGSAADVQARFSRLLQFQDCAAELQAAGLLRYPKLLGFDRQAALVAFESIEDSQSGSLMMVEETFDNSLAFQAGQAIGTLHAESPTRDLEASPPSLPSLDLLRGIPEKMLDNCSFGQISAWSLMQKDQQLVDGIATLLHAERQAPKVPSHCDLRVDQFLIKDEVLYIADWEEFRLADPARDIGGFAGEWLYRSILDIVTTRGDTTSFTDFEMTHDVIVQRGVEKLERLRPRVVHFWDGYRSVRGAIDPQLHHRATAFAGWHTLDRLTASALRSVRLSGIERAAAGVGRAALLQPERFAAALGFEETA